jgi:hypothetical protein
LTHLPFIVAAYAVTVVTVVLYGVAAAMRLGRSRRLLAAAEAARPGGRAAR